MIKHSSGGMKLSRRTFLEAMTALGGSAALGPWASALASDNLEVFQPVTPQDLLNKNVKVINTFHDMHCHGSCILKAHVQNGRVLALTSAGDIPLEGCTASDEDIFHIQRRPCLKGLSERKRIYAPDRLKYPMIQTIERGNINGFKRVTWDEALDRACEAILKAKERQKELGYIPIWEHSKTLLPYMGPYLNTYGNMSAGNQLDSNYAGIGKGVLGHPASDMLNSRFILCWSADSQSTSPHLPFIMTKAKERGIPIVVIDTRYTGTVGAMGTGADGIPAWICPRPETDSAILAAMANTIYRRKLHDEAYLKKYCFGFYPNDSVVSQSPINDPMTGKPYKGQRFTVPAGESFVEYLDSLQKQYGGEAGVLRWASELSGVPAKTIENLAIKYATTKPACIYSGAASGGAQRSGNSLYFCWLSLALAAMTGNATVRGGGFGPLRRTDGMALKLGPAPKFCEAKKFAPIRFSLYMQSKVLETGLDNRTAQQLRDDVLRLNGIDLGPNAHLEIDMIWRGAGSGDRFNQSSSINPKILAYKNLKSIISCERVLCPSARYSDIIFPVVTQFEQNYFHGGRVKTDTNVVRQLIDPMYECKTDNEINELFAKRLGIPWSMNGMTDLDVMRQQWAGAKLPEAYKKIDPDMKLPSFEEMLKTANLQLPVPPEESIIPSAKFEPGKFPTDTGMINFYSPFLASRDRVVMGVPSARYVRPPQGYEDIMEGKKSPASGRVYTLQYTTPHLIHRCHSVYDNTSMLMDTIPHGVMINPQDAAQRNIQDGEKVYVYNDMGCTKLKAIVTKAQPKGVVSITQGAWYQPSKDETYEAWFDADYDGKAEKHVVPVDVGGCMNVLLTDQDTGVSDPVLNKETGDSCGMYVNGLLCEVSKTLPNFG